MYSNHSAQIEAKASSGTGKGQSAKQGNSSWFVAMSKSWGKALDKQADKIVNLSNELSTGIDSPAAAVRLSAEAHKFNVLSTAASTAQNSAGRALETLARKQ